jgi:anti-sigma B factor antagonist
MPLDVTITKKENGVLVVAPDGSIDSDTYLILEKKVDEALNPQTKAIIFDMKNANYISSSGLGVIFATRKTIEKNQGKLYLVNLKPAVKKVFDIVKALPSQSLFETVEELDNYLDKMQHDMNS